MHGNPPAFNRVVAPPTRLVTTTSLLAMPAGRRLAGALIAVALLWLAVGWALDWWTLTGGAGL